MKAKGKSTFSDYARPQALANTTYRPAPTAVAEDDFMASLLSTVAAPEASASNRKRKSSPDIPSSEPMEPSSDSSFFSAGTGRKRFDVDEEEEEEDLWAQKKGVMGKKPRVSDATIVPRTTGNRDENDDYSMEVDEVMIKPEPIDEDEDDIEIKPRDVRPLTSASGKTNLPAPRRKVINSSSVKYVKPEPVVKLELESKPVARALPNGKAAVPGSTHWSTVQDALAPTVSDLDEVKAPMGSTKADNVLEKDGSLRMFWLDHLEQDGVVHLVGKVQDRQTGKWVSACVSVNGIQRNLYVKPRPKRYCK